MVFQKGNKLGRKFQPGQSGNPNGRPRHKTITEVILKEMGIEVKDGVTKRDVIARVLVDKAMNGDFQFVKEALERIDGKVSQPIVGDEEAAPIFINLVKAVEPEAEETESEEDG